MALDDDELELLKQRYLQRFGAPQLEESTSPYADLGLNLAGGVIDQISKRSAANLAPVQTVTGVNMAPAMANTTGIQADVQRQIASRKTAARQKALDDMTMIKSLEELKNKGGLKELQDARIKALEAQANAANAKATGKTEDAKAQKDIRDLEINLRKEYQGLDSTKDTQKVASAYAKVQEAANNPSAAGDLSLIFAYMKMLDPGSTVRESEFANAQNAAGVPDQVRNAWNRAKNGERLNAAQRQDFVSQAGGIYNAQLKNQKQFDDQYTALASQYGVSPNNILRSYAPATAQKPQLTKEQALMELQRRRAAKPNG